MNDIMATASRAHRISVSRSQGSALSLTKGSPHCANRRTVSGKTLPVTRIFALADNLLRALLVVVFCSTFAYGQSYPLKPIRLIIPFPPGGSSDIVGREFAQHLSHALRTQIVIDNRGGANGVVGSQLLAKAPADGHSLMFHILTSHITNPLMYKNIRYDVERDFSSVTLVGWSGLVFVANPAFSIESLSDLLSRSSSITMGSFGTGSLAHLSIEFLRSTVNVKVSHIPYNGAGPAVVATLGGHVPISVVGLPAALHYIKSGRLRPLAVTGIKRSPQLPDVPTVSETPGLAEFNTGLMYALLAPAHTPEKRIKQIQRSAAEVLKYPDVQHRLFKLGLDYIIGSTPEEMDAYIKQESREIARLVRVARIDSQ